MFWKSRINSDQSVVELGSSRILVVKRWYGSLSLVEPWSSRLESVQINKSESNDSICRTCDSNNSTKPHYFQLVHVPKINYKTNTSCSPFLNSLEIIFKNDFSQIIFWPKFGFSITRLLNGFIEHVLSRLIALRTKLTVCWDYLVQFSNEVML